MLKTILLFGLLGPVIGDFIFVATMALQSAKFINHSFTEITNQLGFGIWATLLAGILGIPAAIFIGVVPACISGYSYWIVSLKLKLSNCSRIKRFLIGCIVSFLMTTGFVLYLYLFDNSSRHDSFLDGWWFFIWPGTISGGICGIFVKLKPSMFN
jgi:hypothetical protein